METEERKDYIRKYNDYIIRKDKKTGKWVCIERLLTMSDTNGNEYEYFNFYYGNEDKYPRFYYRPDIINVDKVSDIPIDYAGLMGVPITVIGKLDRKVFELVGMLGDNDDGSGNFLGKTNIMKPDGSCGKEKYKRFVIRRLDPPVYYTMFQNLMNGDID